MFYATASSAAATVTAAAATVTAAVASTSATQVTMLLQGEDSDAVKTLDDVLGLSVKQGL